MAEQIAKPIVDQSTPAQQPVPVSVVQNDPKPIEPVDSEPKPEGDWQNLIPQEHYLTSPLFYEVANYLGVEQGEYEQVKEKLSEITEYVIKSTNSNKLEDVLTGLRSLEEKVMPPGIGERRYAKIYQYVRLLSQRDSFNKALKALERGPVSG